MGYFLDSEKIFAIGDIHGCAEELESLLSQLPIEKNDTIVFLGDYIDRGPNSKKVIDLILELKKGQNIVCLMGNHESMAIDFIKDPSSAQAGLFIMNGGSATLASYTLTGDHFLIPDEHIAFYQNLELFYETKDYFFVHAGVPNVPLKKINSEEHALEMLWVRSSFHKSKYKWSKTIVHGHTVVDEVEISKKRINLDTGCVFKGKLSAIELPSQKIYQVNARKEIPHVYLKEAQPTPRIATRFTGNIPVFIEGDHGLKAFQTLNYNEFGMLLQDLEAAIARFEVGEIIKGKIGDARFNQVEFTGQVVRTQQKNETILYGVKMIEPLLKS